MKISESWLREWINPPLTTTELAAQLTIAGLEVDSVAPVSGEFTHVIVAKVIQTTPHPEADKLTLCEVDTGQRGIFNVVCGARNVRRDLMVALALPGAKLPNGMHIKETVLRGQPSQGMLCSQAELGLEANSEGIIELADDAPLGADLRDYLSLNDNILDINLTPNRADCFSVMGIAREVAALNELPLKLPTIKSVRPHIEDQMQVKLIAAEACPNYCCRIVRNINAFATTPLWMKERLRRAGLRPIHPVVDVTNYVMLELGQPLHAFNLATIDDHIEIRFSHPHETLVLLDGQTISLDSQKPILVIADNTRPLALAGIMGGEESAVAEETMDILLESAFFNPPIIAGVARRFGLCSDSSQRYERGVDPTLQARALERATQLLQMIVGGDVGPLVQVSDKNHLPQPISVRFNPALVKKITGVTIPEIEMQRSLTYLGLTISSEGDNWLIQVPPHRFDITLPIDIVEEIIRLHGYEKMQALPLTLTTQSKNTNTVEWLHHQIALFFSGRGYNETISYSFVDPDLQTVLYPHSEALALLNPISSELAVMRVSLWPGLLASMMYNIHRQQTAIKFFEMGVNFDMSGGELVERPCIAGLITGERGSLNWSEQTHTFDFYDLKGDIQALCKQLHLDEITFTAATHCALHPGQSASIHLHDELIGWIGILHPRFMDELELDKPVILFELNLKSLYSTALIRYQPISKFPQIRRDLSFLVDKNISALQIENAVRELIDTNWLKSFNVFDIYTGQSIPTDKKSIAIALTLQDNQRTLIDSEVETLMGAVLTKLGDKFAIILRD